MLGSVTGYNWNAISAISNIALSLLTLGALALTLHTVRVSNYPKGKLMFRKAKKPLKEVYEFKFINLRSVPITIIHRGFYVKTTDNKELVVKSESKRRKLEWSDLIYFAVNKSEIDDKLLKLGYENGREVSLFAFVKTGSNKVYSKRIHHKIYKEIESGTNEFKLKLKEDA